MEGTDVYQYKDADRNSDHTFIGNGCPNQWENNPPYYGGSTTACSKRILKTEDGEDQLTGVDYSFQAAASGSGGTTVTADNTNSPDSFCPLGWQLPYGGSGGDYYDKSKSWRYLFTQYNIPYDQGQGIDKVGLYPFSYIHSGAYSWSLGVLMQQGSTGHYWSLSSSTSHQAYRLHFMWQRYTVQALDKSNGGSLRCVFCVSSSTARWQELLQI